MTTQIKINKIVKVELLGMTRDEAGNFREVEIPVERLSNLSDDECLEEVFVYGQNEVQSKNKRSVMGGDVIHFNGKQYLILDVGFSNITGGEYELYTAQNGVDRYNLILLKK